MAGWYLSKQARQSLRAARALARERQHFSLGPSHLLAAILQQWDDEHAAGPALLRACGLTTEQATNLTDWLVHLYDNSKFTTPAVGPRPNPALRRVLAQAYRIAAQARAPYVGTEHLVLAMISPDFGVGLRRQGISYQQAAEQLATLRHSEQTVEDVAIEPLEVVAVPTPAAAEHDELARQQAEQYPIDGRVSTLHHLLALLMGSGAKRLLGELGVNYNAVLERILADGALLVEADGERLEEGPLKGWKRYDLTPQEWEVVHSRIRAILFDGGLREQGVRFHFNFTEDRTRFWVHIHPGDSGLTHQQVLDRLMGRSS